MTTFAADQRTSGCRSSPSVSAQAPDMARAVADDQRIALVRRRRRLLLRRSRVRQSSPPGVPGGDRPGTAAEKRWRETGMAETIPAVAPTVVTSRCLCRRRTSSTARRRGGGQLHQWVRRPIARVHDSFDAQEAATRSRSVPARPFRARSRPTSRSQFYAAVRAPNRAVAGVTRSDRLLRRPAPHRPGCRRDRRELRDNGHRITSVEDV